MKSVRVALIAVVSCLAFAGCESTRQGIATGVREKFSGPAYERRVIEGDASMVFEATKATAERMSFRITRSGVNQGVIEGVSGIASDDRLRGSRQRTIKIRIEPASGGGVEVAVLFTEIVEDDFNKSAGQTTEVPLRGHPLYTTFFYGLTQSFAK
jgi:hypothetical protein